MKCIYVEQEDISISHHWIKYHIRIEWADRKANISLVPFEFFSLYLIEVDKLDRLKLQVRFNLLFQQISYSAYPIRLLHLVENSNTDGRNPSPLDEERFIHTTQ